MTDNFLVTEGLGATVRSVEKSSSQKSQVVILDKGGSGAESLLTGTLPVNNSGTFVKQENGPNVGSIVETAPSTDTASSGLNGRLQRIAQRLTSLIALLPTSLGLNGGLKVEGVSSGTVIPVSGTITTTDITDTQLRATAVPVSVSSLPSRTITNSGTFLIQDNGSQMGIVTEVAPSIDTSSSGLNGRLQRIAQRITSLIALFPTSLGGNGGLRIEGVSSGTVIPISGTVDTELSAAVALDGTILKSVSVPVLGKALLVSDNTNLIQPLGDATNGLDLDITRLSSLVAGTSYIGVAGKNSSEIDVVPTLSVASTYASGDYVGTSGTAMTFSGASRINNSTGTILSAVLIDYASQIQPCELWLFDTAPTPPTDNAAWSISDGNSARCIGIISFVSYYSSALNSVSFVPSLNIGFQTISASTSLYGCLVTRGTPTYANGDLTVRLTINQD